MYVMEWVVSLLTELQGSISAYVKGIQNLFGLFVGHPDLAATVLALRG